MSYDYYLKIQWMDKGYWKWSYILNGECVVKDPYEWSTGKEDSERVHDTVKEWLEHPLV